MLDNIQSAVLAKKTKDNNEKEALICIVWSKGNDVYDNGGSLISKSMEITRRCTEKIFEGNAV